MQGVIYSRRMIRKTVIELLLPKLRAILFQFFAWNEATDLHFKKLFNYLSLLITFIGFLQQSIPVTPPGGEQRWIEYRPSRLRQPIATEYWRTVRFATLLEKLRIWGRGDLQLIAMTNKPNGKYVFTGTGTTPGSVQRPHRGPAEQSAVVRCIVVCSELQGWAPREGY